MIELKPSVILDTLLFNYDWTEAFSHSGYPALQLWFSLLFNYDWTEAFSYSGYPALQLWLNWSLQLFWIPCSSIMIELKPSVLLDTLLFTYDWIEAFCYSGYHAFQLGLNWSLQLFWISYYLIMTELKLSVILDILLFLNPWVILDTLLFDEDWTEAFSYSGHPALHLWLNWSLQLFRIPCSSLMIELKPTKSRLLRCFYRTTTYLIRTVQKWDLGFSKAAFWRWIQARVLWR